MPFDPYERRANDMISARVMLLVVLFASACTGSGDGPDYVVRLGNRYLTRDELSSSMASLTVLQDSAEASRQLVEQWITGELLFNEAVRRGLRSDQHVVQLLEENEHSVLISALLSRLYEEEDANPDEQGLISYYEQNKEHLKLTEPFVRVRYLVTASVDSANKAIEYMETLDESNAPDSVWKVIADRFTEDPESSALFSDSFYPEARIFSTIPGLSGAIEQLSPGQILTPFEMDGTVHVVQLVERLPIGAIPDRQLLEAQLRARIVIENRKQLYARQVQRLRNEALAREELIIR